MTYWVYENWVAEGHTAYVHEAGCSFCNDGAGCHPGAGEENGQWLGPFDTVALALQAAERTGGTFSRCRFCSP